MATNERNSRLPAVSPAALSAPGHQGQGLGRRIVRGLEAVATRRSLTGRLNLVAAPDVAPFYRRLGYEDTGSLFMGKDL